MANNEISQREFLGNAIISRQGPKVLEKEESSQQKEGSDIKKERREKTARPLRNEGFKVL